MSKRPEPNIYSRIHNTKRWYIYIFHCRFPCIWPPYVLIWALCTMQIQDEEGKKNNPGDKGVAFFLLRGKIKICWKSADYIFRSITRWQLAVSVCSFPANLLFFSCFLFFLDALKTNRLKSEGDDRQFHAAFRISAWWEITWKRANKRKEQNNLCRRGEEGDDTIKKDEKKKNQHFLFLKFNFSVFGSIAFIPSLFADFIDFAAFVYFFRIPVLMDGSFPF